MHALRRPATVAAAAGFLVAAAGGVAFAVSSGGYQPSEQNCSPSADDHSDPSAEPGCHNAVLAVEDGSGHRYAEIGTYQTPDGTSVHNGDIAIDSNGDGSGLGVTVPFDINDPTATTPQPHTGTPNTDLLAALYGWQLYFGADDNLDNGEHDSPNGRNGTSQNVDGPSDGGSILVSWHPTAIQDWNPTDLMTILTNPIPILSVGTGACADGICFNVETARTAIYHGGNNGRSRDAYDYQGKQWDPSGCSGASGAEQEACRTKDHPGGMNDWKRDEAQNVYAEPGVQVFEDPDPNGSPLPPYPLPAAYVGTCGVTLGGGAEPMPASPVTNSANQLQVSTGC